MASKAVVDAVKAAIGDSWNGLAVVEMNTEGEAGSAEFLLVQFPVSNTDRPVIDRRYYREEGGFRLVLHMNRGVGMSNILTKSDQLTALFRDKNLGGGVRTQVPSSPFLDDSNDSGNFFQAAIVVPYTYDFQT